MSHRYMRATHDSGIEINEFNAQARHTLVQEIVCKAPSQVAISHWESTWLAFAHTNPAK